MGERPYTAFCVSSGLEIKDFVSVDRHLDMPEIEARVSMLRAQWGGRVDVTVHTETHLHKFHVSTEA